MHVSVWKLGSASVMVSQGHSAQGSGVTLTLLANTTADALQQRRQRISTIRMK